MVDRFLVHMRTGSRQPDKAPPKSGSPSRQRHKSRVEEKKPMFDSALKNQSELIEFKQNEHIYYVLSNLRKGHSEWKKQTAHNLQRHLGTKGLRKRAERQTEDPFLLRTDTGLRSTNVRSAMGSRLLANKVPVHPSDKNRTHSDGFIISRVAPGAQQRPREEEVLLPRQPTPDLVREISAGSSRKGTASSVARKTFNSSSNRQFEQIKGVSFSFDKAASNKRLSQSYHTHRLLVAGSSNVPPLTSF
jgi:hypothetical protein